MVKTLNCLDYEMKSDGYIQSRRESYAAQILYEISDMLSALTRRNNSGCDKYAGARYGDLSKEAKKELYLRYRDKGYEH